MIYLALILAVCLSGCSPGRPALDSRWGCVGVPGCHTPDLTTYGKYTRYWNTMHGDVRGTLNNKPERGVWKVQ